MDAMLRKALRKYSGLRTQVDNVLLGDDGDAWEAQLKNFLAKRPCWVKIESEKKPPVEVVKKVLTPFITITTGGTTKDRLVSDIEAMPATISSYAKSMMENEAFIVSKEKGTVVLVSLSIADLGFTEAPRTDEFMTLDFCARFSAERLNGQVLELCQPEDGPELRKEWKDQPKDTAVWVAMERIPDSDGNPRVWRVVRGSDGNRWLDGDWAYPDVRWCLGDRVVFRLRKI